MDEEIMETQETEDLPEQGAVREEDRPSFEEIDQKLAEQEAIKKEQN